MKLKELLNLSEGISRDKIEDIVADVFIEMQGAVSTVGSKTVVDKILKIGKAKTEEQVKKLAERLVHGMGPYRRKKMKP